MKNIILTALVIFSFVNLAQSQNFGVKGAYLFSNMAVDKDLINENNNRTGFSVGFINRTQTSSVFYQTELLWSRKGAKYTLNGGTQVDAKLDYIEIPVSIGINLFNTPISIYGGGYAAYLLKADYEYLDANENVFATFDNKDAFKKFDFGFQTGLQFQISNILLDARFSRGLSNVEDGDIQVSNQTFTANETKNFNVQLGVSLLF